MAGRSRYPREYPRQAYDNRHDYLPGGPPSRAPIARPMPPHSSRLEEEVEIQHHEIQRLLGENRRLVEDRSALQRELSAAKDERRRMNTAIAEIEEENELHSRKLIDKTLKLEAEIHDIKPLKSEAAQLHAEVKRLKSIRHDLSGQVQILKNGIAKLTTNNKQLPALRTEHERILEELMHARDAIVFEKKRDVELMEQRQAMEKNLVSMARDVEKLRAELATDVGPWSTGGSYVMKYGSSDVRYSPYGDKYGFHLGAADKGPLYGSSSGQQARPEKSRKSRR